MRDPMLAPIFGGFPKLGHLFGGSLNKDYRILWSNLGSPYFGKLPYTHGEARGRAAALDHT